MAPKFRITTSFDSFLHKCNGTEITSTLTQVNCKPGIDYPCKIDYDAIDETYCPWTHEHIDYLNSLPHGRPIRAGKATQVSFLCWQWKTWDEIFFPCILTHDRTYLLYCYDDYWLNHMGIIFKYDSKNQLYELNSNIRVSHENNEGPITFVGGWGNPSHFFGQYFSRYIVIARNQSSFSNCGIIAFKMPSWQLKLLHDLFEPLEKNLSLIDLTYFTPSHRNILLLHTKNTIIFEDVPQWLGLQVSRAFFREYLQSSVKSIFNISNTFRQSEYLFPSKMTNLIYLSRAYHETVHATNKNERRVLDYKDVAHLLYNLGFTIVFPENHTIISLQKMLDNCEIVIADPGSCNIHALLSSTIKKLILLGDTSLAKSRSHPSLRHIEWFASHIGRSLQICVGDESSGARKVNLLQVPSLKYRDAIIKLFKASITK